MIDILASLVRSTSRPSSKCSNSGWTSALMEYSPPPRRPWYSDGSGHTLRLSSSCVSGHSRTSTRWPDCESGVNAHIQTIILIVTRAVDMPAEGHVPQFPGQPCGSSLPPNPQASLGQISNKQTLLYTCIEKRVVLWPLAHRKSAKQAPRCSPSRKNVSTRDKEGRKRNINNTPPPQQVYNRSKIA